MPERNAGGAASGQAGEGAAARVEALSFGDAGGIPNNPRLPALLYRGALPPGDPAAAEARLARHGWTRAWRNGIFDYHHYHSTAHEVLAVVAGTVRVMLGGPGGRAVGLRAGDVVLLPAGTGHRNLGGSDDLLVVGAYDGGRDYDLLTADSGGHDAAVARIAAVPDWARDPVTGERHAAPAPDGAPDGAQAGTKAGA
ncbi:cupin domain-containing protein [Roseomonas sp. NAR14]|uniref:Cupin domain-containing protein n=1 Tax=Roseomonas acroporae TaxID=2937791 RepID=A0A9X1Y7C1_9PROT|nr:cupin domain-containing protein [Roseomonas acroporae]MCK8784851.1 cupin domain-containing protein [Roseomonas acroporae]